MLLATALCQPTFVDEPGCCGQNPPPAFRHGPRSPPFLPTTPTAPLSRRTSTQPWCLYGSGVLLPAFTAPTSVRAGASENVDKTEKISMVPAQGCWNGCYTAAPFQPCLTTTGKKACTGFFFCCCCCWLASPLVFFFFAATGLRRAEAASDNALQVVGSLRRG